MVNFSKCLWFSYESLTLSFNQRLSRSDLLLQVQCGQALVPDQDRRYEHQTEHRKGLNEVDLDPEEAQKPHMRENDEGEQDWEERSSEIARELGKVDLNAWQKHQEQDHNCDYGAAESDRDLKQILYFNETERGTKEGGAFLGAGNRWDIKAIGT